MSEKGEEFIAVSPKARDPFEIPDNMSLPDYVFRNLNANLPRIRGKPWIVGVDVNYKINFEDVEIVSRRIASALTRRGFKKGDTLYYVTYESARIYLILLAVWRLGGITRGWAQREEPTTYAKQINHSYAKFVLLDEETRPKLQEAISMLDHEVKQFCFGDVEGATSVDELFNDDGSAFPEHVQINPREDVIYICGTSGSTGEPKAVMHTHYTTVAVTFANIQFMVGRDSTMTMPVNFSGILGLISNSLCVGATLYIISKFSKEKFFDYLEKYKPEEVSIYPFLAAWVARNPEIKTRDLSFVKGIGCGGAPCDFETARLIQENLPHASFHLNYGMTECLSISSTRIKQERWNPLVYGGDDGTLASVGNLFPHIKAKVKHIESGVTLGPGERGIIYVKTPTLMLGYQGPDRKPYMKDVDEQGYFCTGDYGYIDADSNVFLIEKMSFVFWYSFNTVLPSEIESVILEHPSIQNAGVLGIDNPEKGRMARAYIVVKSGHHVTADEIKQHVASRLPRPKHLHGGVRFLDALPMNRNNKLDRIKLREIANNEKEN